MKVKLRERLRHKVSSRRGLSTTEVFCLGCLCAIAVVGVILGLGWYRRQVRIGDDNRMVTTALKDAKSETLDKSCVVKGCNGGGDCTHKSGGVDTGYFDPVTNAIIGEKPVGYNEHHTMNIDDQSYEAPEGTMVIRVEYDGTDYTLTWVEGDRTAVPSGSSN